MTDEQAVDSNPVDEGRPRPALGRITRVILKNYKSIVSCDVELQPLTILVGPNGSGKSNFLDALAFVKEALTVGLEQAIRNRGNVERILSAARPPGDDSFSIELHFQLGTGNSGLYTFEIFEKTNSGSLVRRERLEIEGTGLPPILYSIDGTKGSVYRAGVMIDLPILDPDRLFLVRYSEFGVARPAYDLLKNMTFYNPLPDAMRDLKPRDVDPHLRTDSANIASMLRRMQLADPELIWRIEQYMKRVLPGLEAITTVDLAGHDLLRVSVTSDDPAKPYTFDAGQLSDGTLRALAILVALFHHRMGGKSATSLVGIEEPENNLHPATGGAFADALLDAAYDGQVLVTTHSMSLLDGDEIPIESVLAVACENGITRIGSIDEVGRSILRDHLLTAGELLQQGQLLPELKPDGESTAESTSGPIPVGR